MITPLRSLAQRCKRLTPLLAAPAALLLSQGQAKAVLTYNIFESGTSVVVQTSGNLDLTGATTIGDSQCLISGFINIASALICTGGNGLSDTWSISGPQTLTGAGISTADSTSGIHAGLAGYASYLYLDKTYTSGSPIVSSATFNNKTLAGLGFTTTGLIGTWTLAGTTETIQVIIGAPSPSAAVPGPLPLLGAGAAFGWSRRLRRRIAAPLITPV